MYLKKYEVVFGKLAFILFCLTEINLGLLLYNFTIYLHSQKRYLAIFLLILEGFVNVEYKSLQSIVQQQCTTSTTCLRFLSGQKNAQSSCYVELLCIDITSFRKKTQTIILSTSVVILFLESSKPFRFCSNINACHGVLFQC